MPTQSRRHRPTKAASQLSALEDSFGIFVLFVMTEVLSNFLLIAGSTTFDESDPRKLAITLGVGCCCVLLAVRRGLLAPQRIAQHPLLLLLTVLVLMSALWSAYPSLTLRRALAYILTTVSFFYVAGIYAPSQLITRIRWVFAAGVIFSCILALTIPSVGVVSGPANTGAWEGGFFDKIASGYAAVVVILLTLAAPNTDIKNVLMRLIWIAPAALLLIMSQSRTGWIALAIGLFALIVTTILRAPRISEALKHILGVALIGGGASVAVIFYSLVLPALGRTTTFSGRTKLWEGAFNALNGVHLFLGYGYRTFWQTPQSDIILPYIEYWGDNHTPRSGHNGYIDALLELGLLGFVFLLIFLGSLLLKFWRRTCRSGSDPTSAAWLVLLCVFIFENLSYGFALRHSSLFWGMCVLAALSYSRVEKTRRHSPVAHALRPYPG